MNIALIIAGGQGNRMGQDIPKQFMYVEDKPIIIHTLQAFEKHPDIDIIAVVCLEGWETVLQAYANQYKITKLHHIYMGGSNITAIQCTEAILESENHKSSTTSIPRDKLMRTQTPQTFFLGDIYNLHQEALAKGITNSVASCTLMVELGYKLYLTPGSEKNLKITTVDDLEIFKALLTSNKESWIK